MGNKSILFLLVLFAPLVFVSCLTIESEITLNTDESGIAVFQYNLTTLALDINRTDSDSKILPFPILRDEYETSARNVEGISVTNYNLSDNGSRYLINSDIVFESLQSLSDFTGLSLISETLGNNTLLTIIVYETSGENMISEQSLSLVKEKFSKEFFSFKITIPGEIVRVEGATFSGSTVTYKINIEELLNRSETVQFSVEYR